VGLDAVDQAGDGDEDAQGDHVVVFAVGFVSSVGVAAGAAVGGG